MIPSQKLRKLVIDKVVRCMHNSKERPVEGLWDKVAEMLKDDVSLSPLEIKELYYKEILPNLTTNNYGHDEETVNMLKTLAISKVLQKYSQAPDSIEQVMIEIHSTTARSTTDVFKDPNDPLQISTACYPRQPPPTSSTLEDLHQIPIFEQVEEATQAKRSKTGNVHVRDEIGSSITNVETFSAPRDLSYLDHRKWEGPFTFPMYDFETGRVEEYKPPKSQKQPANNSIKRLNFDMCDI